MFNFGLSTFLQTNQANGGFESIARSSRIPESRIDKQISLKDYFITVTNDHGLHGQG